MKKNIIYGFWLLLLLLPLVFACSQELGEADMLDTCVPDGTPVTLYIPFAGTSPHEVEVATRGEASAIDEAHIHDIYVMIFDNGDLIGDNYDSPRKIYGHYFSYEHLKSSLQDLVHDENECWYAENKNIQKTVTETTGAVKISTIACSNATLVVIANVTNAVMDLDGGDALARLNAVLHLKELQGLEVRLEQNIVNRKDLFLMTGKLDEVGGAPLTTGAMRWGTLPHDYDSDYTVSLVPVDAKVKFRVKVKPEYISAVTPVYWQVCNTPDRCYLDSEYADGKAPEDAQYFASQQYYFEGTEIDGDDTWYSFCFYILENREEKNGTATEYYQRELQEKFDTGEPGYKGPNGPESGSFSDHFVENGDWVFAPTYGTYVRFDLVLTLTPEGIENIGGDDPEGLTIGHALTSDAIFTVHLGQFASSDTDVSANLNNYETLRGHSYTYNITVNNTRSIYTEVVSDNEAQAGQEGFLLLTDTEIINADAHYEYHQVSFPYRPELKQEKFSWYVKTPFSEGGPKIIFDEVQNKFTYTADGLDYLWVKFGINETVDGPDVSAHWDDDEDPSPWFSEALGENVSPYTKRRHEYPGDSHYDPDWEPGQRVTEGVPVKYGPSDPDDPMYRMIPDLMDITQLIRYIFWETARETAHRKNPASAPASAFIADDARPSTVPVLRFTAYIDEFYYEEHPLEHTVDQDLWREFVNAQPREMHILSDAQQSRDRKSDVILSSHSIIQQSIQTIYNIYAADLHTLWGAEHEDEMRKLSDGWPYWPGDPMDGKYDEERIDGKTVKTDDSTPGRSGDFNTELGKWNGRLNSAYIWEFYSSRAAGGRELTGRWNDFLEYSVHNEIPELKAAPDGNDGRGYQGMAYSCLTRNRDNNGDGIVDRNEVRWYLAACNQLAGMWVGNESLSIDTRIYRPSPGQWRAHIVSSTGRRVSWAEEGGGATEYHWDFWDSRSTWPTIGAAAAGESVRCLRNIGTFSDEGEIKDISYAPYDYEIEHYFTKEGPEPEGPFVFHFDRLNPKSIRQLSESELPYTDQFNQFNSVYLKFETQSRADNVGDVTSFDTINTENPGNLPTIDSINPEVSKLGYNPYCPPGYRFPNHVEMLLMSLYLPKNYFERDKDGNAYPSDVKLNIPTRTYFDRGYYGENRTGMSPAEITRERRKIGWGYTSGASKQSCLDRGITINQTRCVRDVNMTGHIDGDIILSSETLCAGDPAPLTFSFYSSAAAFVSASLKLCYTDGSGIYHEQDIPIKTPPAGLQYMASQKVTLPSFAELGLDPDLVDETECKFKITMRNTATSHNFEHAFMLSASHLSGCKMIFPSVSDPDKGTPVQVHIGTANALAHLTNVKLYWKAPDAAVFTAKELFDDDDDDPLNNINSFSEDVYLRDIIGDGAWATAANRTKEYQFYATATCSDGTSYVSPTYSNEIVRFNYTPNPVPAGGWTSISQCNRIWSNNITNLDFSAGDRIEADMDLTACRYKYLTGVAATDLGQDNIIGFSYGGNVGKIEKSVIWYYPSVQNLVNSDDPADWGWIRSRVHAGAWNAYTPDEGVLDHMNLILDKDGLIRDGKRFTYTWSKWAEVKAGLAAASTVQIGSTEGVHKSRATYNYVRVVRKKPDAVTPHPRD